jgi:predicted DNA-binding transcriptional regulator AlpA
MTRSDTSHTHLPPNLPPRGLSRERAAEYVGIGATKFDEMVADGRMPKPIRIDGRVLWDRRALDQFFDALGTSESVNPWDQVED